MHGSHFCLFSKDFCEIALTGKCQCKGDGRDRIIRICKHILDGINFIAQNVLTDVYFHFLFRWVIVQCRLVSKRSVRSAVIAEIVYVLSVINRVK